MHVSLFMDSRRLRDRRLEDMQEVYKRAPRIIHLNIWKPALNSARDNRGGGIATLGHGKRLWIKGYDDLPVPGSIVWAGAIYGEIRWPVQIAAKFLGKVFKCWHGRHYSVADDEQRLNKALPRRIPAAGTNKCTCAFAFTQYCC
jgi:hypothetical protein